MSTQGKPTSTYYMPNAPVGSIGADGKKTGAMGGGGWVTPKQVSKPAAAKAPAPVKAPMPTMPEPPKVGLPVMPPEPMSVAPVTPPAPPPAAPMMGLQGAMGNGGGMPGINYNSYVPLRQGIGNRNPAPMDGLLRGKMY